MAAMILCVLVMLALCVLKLVKRTDYRRESDYFYENNLDEYGENEAYTSEYIVTDGPFCRKTDGLFCRP